ncbi:MAG: hypothetical protein CM1200mP9_01210 [Gammaproteobacteria bacterium]|nr:MAG: hypothetical protein CM1200mP9_01210 [Gammaproteobacteria bacterium]
MASHAVIDHELDVEGMIFCSFPLHPRGKPSTARAGHLAAIRPPMLFLSGTRDALAEPDFWGPDRAAAGAKLHGSKRLITGTASSNGLADVRTMSLMRWQAM